MKCFPKAKSLRKVSQTSKGFLCCTSCLEISFVMALTPSFHICRMFPPSFHRIWRMSRDTKLTVAHSNRPEHSTPNSYHRFHRCVTDTLSQTSAKHCINWSKRTGLNTILPRRLLITVGRKIKIKGSKNCSRSLEQFLKKNSRGSTVKCGMKG